jgi:malate synthase
MEDAATAEIARVQLWQWCHYQSRLDTGRPITVDYLDAIIDEMSKETPKIVKGVKSEHVELAKNYLQEQIRKEWASEFLTSDLMPYLAEQDGVKPAWHKSML